MKTIWLTLIVLLCFLSCNNGSSKSEPPSDNQGTSTPPSGTNPPAVIDSFISFATLQKDVISTCIKCHSVDRPGKPRLVAKQEYIANMNDVLFAVNDNKMPPTAMGFASLTLCQKAVLQKWYDLGSPEDSNIKVNSLTECI